MYKIYINDHPLCLLKYEDADDLNDEGYELYPYMGQKGNLINVIDRLEKSKEPLKIGLYSTDYNQLKSDFKALFETIKASGGIIRDSEDRILFIYRRRKWDLPKGKKEKGESKKEGALREVAEETGLETVKLINKIGKTRHTYRHPNTGKRILKVTHWYEMESTGETQLDLQEEEDIEDAKWLTLTAFFEGNYSTFANIVEILLKYKSLTINT